MKKTVKIITLLCVAVVIATCFVACTPDELFESVWEVTAIKNAQGEIVAYGEGYAPDDSLHKVTVTCTVSRDNDIEIIYADEHKTLKGKMVETSTGADKSVNYSIEFNDGTTGRAVYSGKTEDGFGNKVNVTESELVITIGEDYSLYFARGARIN